MNTKTMNTDSPTAGIVSRKAYLSNTVIDNYRITIIVTEFADGWKRREVILPDGVKMYGHSGQAVNYKKDFPFTKIEYMLFGQRRVCELYPEKPNNDTNLAK
jgi:hypothetical protein